MILDSLFARNTRRRPGVSRGNYAFRHRRKRVRLDVHRLDLNPETDATRREQRRRVMRSGFKFAVVCLLATGIFSVGKIVVRDAFLDNNRFRLQHISVVTDGELTPSRLITVSGLSEGMNMLDIPLVEVRERLENLPQVRSAKVSRGYPGMIFLEVEQRHPVAWLECPEARLESKVPNSGCLLDAEGYVLPSGEVTPEQERLPCIRVGRLQKLVPGQKTDCPEVLAALKLLRTHEGGELAHALSIRRIDASRTYALETSFDPPLKVVFPSQGVERQFGRLARVLQQSAQQKWQLASVDLLVEHNVPITLRNAPAIASSGTASPAQKRPEPARRPVSRTN